MGKRITLKDVAAHAGVSRSAASLALRGDVGLGEETRERILQSMETLGYVYNRSAAAMREKTPRRVGIVVTNFRNAFLSQSLQAMEVELDRLGYHTIISSSLGNADRQTKALQSMREFGVTGVIMAAVEGTTASTARELEESGIACLSYTRYDDEVDYVGPDDIAGGRLAAQHLLSHGVETMAFVGTSDAALAPQLRCQGIEAALDEAGRGETLMKLEVGVGLEGAYALGKDLAQRGELPQGIICFSDMVAIGLMRALHDAGIEHFPRIIGFDDIELAKYSLPSLTTVSSDPDHSAQLAANLLVKRLQGDRDPDRVHFTDSHIVVRESCGCATPRDM